MIRSVPIPTSVSRMGCAPGGDCCPDCASHKPAALGRLGATECDQDGNCYTDGVLTAAPLTTGAGCPPGMPTCNPGGLSNTAMYVLGAAVLIGLREISSRRR